MTEYGFPVRMPSEKRDSFQTASSLYGWVAGQLCSENAGFPQNGI